MVAESPKQEMWNSRRGRSNAVAGSGNGTGIEVLSGLPAVLLIPALIAGAVYSGAAAGAGHAASGDVWRSELYGADWHPPGPEKDFYTDRLIQDYSYAGYRLGEPIPDVPAPVFGRQLFDVTEPPYHADPTGSDDSTAAIQQAIDDAAAAGRGVVYLPEGTYRVSATSSNTILRIENSNIVLRGAGVDQTFILNTTYNRRGQRIINVLGPPGGWRDDLEPAVPVTEDLMGPTRVIPVGSVDAFSPGDWIVLRTDTTVGWVDEHHEPDWRDHAGTYTHLNGFAYYRQVLAVNEEAGTLLIDIPTRYAVKTRDAARAHPAPGLIHEVGLENFSIGNVEHPGTDDDQWSSSSYANPEHHAYEVHGSAVIGFSRTRDCWVRNVHSFRPEENTRNTHFLSNGVAIGASRSLTLENVRMQRPLYGGGGGNGYSFRTGNASDILFRQCLASHNRHGFVFSSMGSTGNVIHDSKDRYTNTQAAGTGHAGGANSDHHMFFAHSNLVDASRVRESMFEARYRPFTASPQHNITAAHSTFWNTMGLGSGPHAVRSDQARFGYVIGTQGLDGSTRYGVVLGDRSRPQTLPTDHVEGVGEGATLFPPSLYLHQLERRRSSIELELMRVRDAVLPRNTGTVSMHAVIGAALDVRQSDLAWNWSLVDGPGPVEFTDPASPETGVSMETPGAYRLRVRASGGGAVGEATVPMVFSPFPGEIPEPEAHRLVPTDDAHVQSSDPDSNFGGSSTLRAKALGDANERQVFLRFDVSGVARRPDRVVAATLHLRKTAHSTPHAAALYRGIDSNWSEESVTYNKMPVADERITSWTASGDPGELALDVTPALVAALLDNGLLTLRLVILEQYDPVPLVRYASKEHGDEDWRPRLEVAVAPPGQTYHEWAQDGGVETGDASPTCDPFGNGVPHLVRYATGLSPAASGDRFVERDLASGKYRVEIPWRKALSGDAWFLVQESTDLANWQGVSPVAWATVPRDDDRFLLQGEVAPVNVSTGSRFYRVVFFLADE